VDNKDTFGANSFYPNMSGFHPNMSGFHPVLKELTIIRIDALHFSKTMI